MQKILLTLPDIFMLWNLQVLSVMLINRLIQFQVMPNKKFFFLSGEEIKILPNQTSNSGERHLNSVKRPNCFNGNIKLSSREILGKECKLKTSFFNPRWTSYLLMIINQIVLDSILIAIHYKFWNNMLLSM